MLDRRARELDGRDRQPEITYGIPYGKMMYGEMPIGPVNAGDSAAHVIEKSEK